MDEIRKFLVQCNYRYQEYTADDIEMALNSFGLILSVQNYSYTDGLDKDLISLEGVISINEIPIQIYLNDLHPYSAPICYVRPTNDMIIKSSDKIDSDGLITLPLEWQPESSDLILLLNMISMMFDEKIPIIDMNTDNHSVNGVVGGKEKEPNHLKISLISKIQEKVKAKELEIESLKQAEISNLNRINQELHKSEAILNNLLNEVDSQIEKLIVLTQIMKSESVKLKKNTKLLKYYEDSSIEDAVITAPLYRQILILFSEDLAITDLIYYLKLGLEHKTISLDIFLRQIRLLSRKQFLTRATVNKAKKAARCIRL